MVNHGFIPAAMAASDPHQKRDEALKTSLIKQIAIQTAVLDGFEQVGRFDALGAR